MTLIELMVVIVILVTLVAGVLPLVSPNNDSRKISDAARSLQTYFMQAQAEAARLGRPVGVGFRETVSGSGVALEAYQMIVPKPYPGSTTQSTVGVQRLDQMDPPETYTLYPYVLTGTPQFANEFAGARLYAIHMRFALPSTTGIIDDPLPPKMFRVGDKINAGGHEFLIVDDKRNLEFQLRANDTASPTFLDPTRHEAPFVNKLICVRLDEVKMGAGASPLSPPVNGYGYEIERQPISSSGNDPQAQAIVSSEAPYQLPAGIAIDLQGSGLEAGTMQYFYKGKPPIMGAVMFSPNGGVESVWMHGNQWLNAARVFLLIGRGENGALYAPEAPPGDYNDAAWYIDPQASDEDLRDLQSRINWLNPDSRWVMIDTATGRATVVANSQVDARRLNYVEDPTASEAQAEQIEAAHDLAHHHDHAATGRGGTNN